MAKKNTALHSLISFSDFAALAGVDDREEWLAKFCLAAATKAIESHCKRRLLRERVAEEIPLLGGMELQLGEYPVAKVRSVFIIGNGADVQLGRGQFRVEPNCGLDDNIPVSITLSPSLGRLRRNAAARVDYTAGFAPDAVPADLAAACFELVSWSMNRYRGRRAGMTGSVVGNWRDGEHFEMSMPENARALLKPYARRTI